MKYPYPITRTKLSQEDYIDKLMSRRRMDEIGEGAFGTVYGSKSGRTVVKIGVVREATWSTHSNVQYLRYLSMTEKYKRNKFFPKLFNVEVFQQTSTRDEYMVVEMERLKEFNRGGHTAAGLIEYCLEDKASFEASKMVFGKMSKSIEQVHKVLAKLVTKYNACIDLHGENVMLRKGGQLVITDPVT